MSGAWVLVLLLCGIGAVALALVQRDRRALGPEMRSVCAVLGLTRSERRALGAVARRAGLASAVSMLISRGCFEHACAVARPGGVEAVRVGRARAAAFGAASQG